MNAESRLKVPWFWDFDKRIQTRVQGNRLKVGAIPKERDV
jgi:hypothetical protein